MLSTSNVSASQAATYYTQDDYYSQEAQQHASYWYGKGAMVLGLSGKVKPDCFGSLLHGFAPDGRFLSGKPIPVKNRRAATDYTFSAPKSVSIAALIQQDARVLEAHHQAVANTLAILEHRYAQTRQSTPTGRQCVKTDNLIAAVFTHATSREMEPQLHSHCVVINATQLPDGQWRSFSNEAAIAHQKLLGEIYQNELAVALKQQGYEIELKSNGQFELAGYSPELLKLFSTRRQQIEQLLATWEVEGMPSLDGKGNEISSNAVRREAATLRSRKQKPKAIDADRLWRGWNALIQLKGMELPAIPYSNHEVRFQDTIQPSKNIETVIEKAIQHCSERSSVFQQSQLERFVLEHHLGEQSFADLQQASAHNPELIQVNGSKYTTQSALNLELNTIQLMQSGKGQMSEIVPPETVNAHLENKSFTVGQQTAIQLASTTNDQFIAWQGVAGSGKTFALQEFQVIAQTQGYRVRGFAPSAEAAHELGKTLQIETETVAGLLVAQGRSLTDGDNRQPEIWIVDEAGLLSMRDAHDLLSRARTENARVILVGDTRQLSAVEAGYPFKSLQTGGMATARLDENLRQQTQELRAAVKLVAQGEVTEGIQALDDAGCIQSIVDSDQRQNQMVTDYLGLSLEERENTLLLAGTNQERSELTQKIRQGLQVEGSLGQDTFTVIGLRQKDLTTAQAAYTSAYELGDLVVPSQDYRKQGLVKHQQYRVIVSDRATNQLTLETCNNQVITVDPAKFAKKTVYQVQSIPVAEGDRLKWTKNDRATGIRNGQTFTVQQIASDDTAHILDSDGKTRQVNLSGNQYLDYAWVSTTYSSQGKTSDRVLALMDGMTLNRESFYVTVSRTRHQLILYTADIAELTRLAQKSTANKNVSDYIPLFQVYPHAQTQKNQTHSLSTTAEHRDLSSRIGDCVGECIRQKLAADRDRSDSLATTVQQPGAGNAAVECDLPIPAPNLDQHIAPLSTAIASYLEQQDLLDCTREFATAVTAINRSFEYLEQATASRTQFTTAIARLDAAVGRQAQFGQHSNAEQQQWEEKPSIKQQWEEKPGINKRTETSPTARERYQQMWQQYSQGMQASNPVKLDYLVGRKAFEDGCSQREIALMLAVGSPYVQQLSESQGKNKAREYANQTARVVCQRQQGAQLSGMKLQKKSLELGD